MIRTYHQRSKFWSLLLYDQLVSRYKVVKIRKCTELPQNYLEH